jgi:hypothetical protein
MTLIVPSILAMTASTGAFSDEWVLLGTDWRGSKWLIDKSSIARQDQQASAWKRIEFSHPYPLFPDGTPIKTVRFLDETNCSQRLVSLKAMEIHDADGTVLMADRQGGDGVHLPPWSNLDFQKRASELVCSRTHQRQANAGDRHE